MTRHVADRNLDSSPIKCMDVGACRRTVSSSIERMAVIDKRRAIHSASSDDLLRCRRGRRNEDKALPHLTGAQCSQAFQLAVAIPAAPCLFPASRLAIEALGNRKHIWHGHG